MYVGSRQELPSDLSIWNGSTVPALAITGLTAHRREFSSAERLGWARSRWAAYASSAAQLWPATDRPLSANDPMSWTFGDARSHRASTVLATFIFMTLFRAWFRHFPRHLRRLLGGFRGFGRPGVDTALGQIYPDDAYVLNVGVVVEDERPVSLEIIGQHLERVGPSVHRVIVDFAAVHSAPLL